MAEANNPTKPDCIAGAPARVMEHRSKHFGRKRFVRIIASQFVSSRRLVVEAHARYMNGHARSQTGWNFFEESSSSATL
jgi:hypothetical protein